MPDWSLTICVDLNVLVQAANVDPLRHIASRLCPDEAFAPADQTIGSPKATSASGGGVKRIAFNDLPAGGIATIALRTNATLASFLRGFRRFPGLQVIEPAA
jgi:hypothetical protein